MKKQVRILATVIMIITIIAMLSNVVFGASGIIDELGKDHTSVDGATEITTLGSTIVGLIQVVGIVVAIVVLLVLGIKYMMGSAEEKAEYKKVMIPYLIGALLIFAASTVVNVVYNMFSNISV